MSRGSEETLTVGQGFRDSSPEPIPALGSSGKTLLIVRLGALGDVIRILPLVRGLRCRWRASTVAWAVGEALLPLVSAHPSVDRVIGFPKLRLSTLPAWFQRLGEIRSSLRPDICLDFQGLAKSGLIALGSGATHRLGLGQGRAREMSWLALHGQNLLPGRSRYDEALDLAGLEPGDWLAGARELRRTWRNDGSSAKALLNGSLPPQEAPVRRGLLFHPGGSKRNLYKRWPPAFYAELGRNLSRRLSEPVEIQYGPGERELAKEIAGSIPGAGSTTSASLLEMFRKLQGARLFVGGDTGPLHVALLAGTPALAIYGPSDPAIYALPRAAPHRVVRWPVPCGPCRNRRCRTLDCLQAVPPAAAEAAAMELLEKAERATGP